MMGIQDDFWAFHRAHPEVEQELARLARRGMAAGRQKLGLRQLFEVVRWERSISGLPDAREEFKLNNNYAPYYARLLMRHNPEMEGLFETRVLRSP